MKLIQYDDICERLFDPKGHGIVVLQEAIPYELLQGMVKEIKQNKRNFVRRPLFYGTTIQMLSSWDIEREVLQNYDFLHVLDERYKIISNELHARMDECMQVDRVKVNASRYLKGSAGIGPHRDNSFSVNFIVIFAIAGVNDFCTAANKNREQEVRFNVVPGDAVLLRGPRNDDERSLRPIHYVKQIKEERYIVTFREFNHEILYRIDGNNQHNN